jgi:acetylornithine/N-succinyldiaminopimelate aminotransferase
MPTGFLVSQFAGQYNDNKMQGGRSRLPFALIDRKKVTQPLMVANRQLMTTRIMPTYGRLPVTFERGDGAWLWDTDGKRYLDAVSGIAVCGLGHAHPAVREALCEQAGTLIHTSNLYGIEYQEQLALRLTEPAGLDNAFFCNSGAEANEAAIKIARLHGHRRGIESPAIIVMENSFHGRTLATLSATGNPKIQEGFEPLVQGFIRVPYNDIAAVEAIAEANPNIAAILVEPIQGEGGVRVPTPNFLPKLRRLCDRHGSLLILDEVQTGTGRTGQFFAFQHTDIVPDVCTVAKALGNGVPIGACLARGGAAEILTAGTHGSTFGGNPLACRAALSVLDTLEQSALIERAEQLGHRLLSNFHERLNHLPHVLDIRGKGLMIGIELDAPCGELVRQALETGLLINVTAGNTIRLLPPLILSDEQSQRLIDTLCPLIQSFSQTLDRPDQ